MLVLVLLCLSSVASVAVCDGQSVLAAKYSYSLVLSSLNYELYWSFDPANENVSIAVRVKTLGWVGLGVSEKGGMENADIVTGRVMNGNAELTVGKTAWIQAQRLRVTEVCIMVVLCNIIGLAIDLSTGHVLPCDLICKHILLGHGLCMC